MSARQVTLTGYAVLGGALLLLAVAGALRPDRVPSAGRLFTWAMGSVPGRWAVLVSWWWLGWHFFVR